MNNTNQDLSKTLQLLRDGLHNTIQSFQVYRMEDSNINPFSNRKESQQSGPPSVQEEGLVSPTESYIENTIPHIDTTADPTNLRAPPRESTSSRKAINKIKGKINLHHAVSQVRAKYGKRKNKESIASSNISVDEDLKNNSLPLLSSKSSSDISNANMSQSRSSETFLAKDFATTSRTRAEKNVRIENELESFLSEVESYIKVENFDQDDPDDIINDTSTYFNDGDKKVDYILVYKKSNSAKMETYLNNIHTEGLDLEVEESTIDKHLMFVKIHATKAFLKKMEQKLPINKWSFRNPNYFEQKSTISFANSTLIRSRGNDKINERAPQSVQRINVTDAERILAVHKLLTRTKFGKHVYDFSLEKMIESKIMVCAFPMHDKTWEWNDVGMISDRQLLGKYWANFNCIFKVQPKQLINKYFGNEIAFYFAWLGFYTKMLLPAVLLGLMVLVYGGSTANVKSINVQSYEISKSEVRLCPICQRNCFYSHLSDSYEISKVNYVLDNAATAIFNILMSFWGVTFLILWKQKERFIKIVWNLSNVNVIDANMRANFYFTKRRKRFTSLTDIEKYKKRQSNWWYLFSTIVMIISTFAIASIIFGLLIMKMDIMQLYEPFKLVNELLYKINYNQLMVELTWSTITIIFIMIIDSITPVITYLLTRCENPKTDDEFEKSYILKLFVLTCITNYSIPIYLAFFRGIFYIPPSKIVKSNYTNLTNDVCDPSGCTVSLACWMTTMLILKLAKAFLVDFVASKMTISFKNLSLNFNFSREWEKNYKLLAYRKTQLIQLHIENIIQYGFVVCFVTASPLISFLVWITNAIKIRLFAIKLIRYQKRPVPTVTADFGIWNAILAIMTKIGILIHILVIAFTTEIIPKLLFFIQNLKFENYMQSKLTDFYYTDTHCNNASTFCEYVGYRNGSSLDYLPIYFKIIGGKLIFTIVMEHLVIVFLIIFTYYVPVMSVSMKKYFNEMKQP